MRIVLESCLQMTHDELESCLQMTHDEQQIGHNCRCHAGMSLGSDIWLLEQEHRWFDQFLSPCSGPLKRCRAAGCRHCPPPGSGNTRADSCALLSLRRGLGSMPGILSQPVPMDVDRGASDEDAGPNC